MPEEKIKPFILFGDGTVSQVISQPIEERDEEGVINMVFHLKPSRTQKEKFNLRMEDYDNQAEEILVRSYPLATQIVLGDGYVDKDFIEWFNIIQKLHYALNQLTGDKDFQKLKRITKNLITKKRIAVGVLRMTENPQANFHYFCFNDLNNNPTAVARYFSEQLLEITKLQKENFRLKGYIEQLTQENMELSTQTSEALKRNMEHVDIVGKPSPQQPTPEELASKDEGF